MIFHPLCWVLGEKLKVKVKLLSHVRLFVTPWTVPYQAPPSMEFSRQEYWSGLPFPSPGDLPDPGIEPGSPALQADALPSESPGKPRVLGRFVKSVNSCLSVLGGFLISPLLRFSFLPSPLPSSSITVTPLLHAFCYFYWSSYCLCIKAPGLVF